MVRFFNRICLPVFLLSGICFFGACNADLSGLFASNDLDVRLAERDTFHFLSQSDRNPLLGDSYSFIAVTDTHIENGNAWGLEKLEDVVQNNSDIKFVVFLGDITQNGSARDMETFTDIAGRLGVPCYPVIGNHDIYFNNWPVWRDTIGSTRYRINGDTATFFVLDTANAFFGKAQLDWLENQIKTAKGRVFVFTHSNLFVKGTFEFQQLTDTEERARIISILHNRCDMMLMGHSHTRIINTAGGVPYISIEDYKGTQIYCLFEVKNNGITNRFEKL